MQAFTTHKGKIAVLDRANIDTDQIIPKQFLKSIKKTGFEEGLFFDWKKKPDGSLDPDFPLNRPAFRGASILVARNNFGCGSSREHAVWAVMQGGFRVVAAPGLEREGQKIPAFADIFAGNAVKNGLLTVELSADDADRIFRLAAAAPELEGEVNLPSQTFRVSAGGKEMVFHFQIDPGVKDYLLKGLDEIGLTLEKKEAIGGFEGRRAPWLTPSPSTR
ncbi:MAG: 3-isopropylmalate dehydratase small subunit [Synergistetes bacterium ADurb.Bin520]|nr:MAG: 3-isopropylmalate dehydratase small subunit [Synergistetes bacterium ADurb.Bin520]